MDHKISTIPVYSTITVSTLFVLMESMHMSNDNKTGMAFELK